MKQDISVYSTESNGFYFPKRDIPFWIQEMAAVMEQYSCCSVMLAAGAVFHREDRQKHIFKENLLKREENCNLLDNLVRLQLTKKKGQNLEPLIGRFEEILVFQEDAITAAVLASSYYSIEELKMRLPRLEEILRNPFGSGIGLKAVTGTIMLADGGPAEGAKGIQMYFYLAKKGINVTDLRVRRMISLLSVVAGQALPLVTQICDGAELWQVEAEHAKLSRIPDITECFLISGAHHILSIAADKEQRLKLHDMAFHLLTGMMDEVLTILDAVYIGSDPEAKGSLKK